MKKYILTTLSFLCLSMPLFAQVFDDADDELVEEGFEYQTSFFKTTRDYVESVEDITNPGTGGVDDSDPDPAPIDDYIPYLLVGAMGIVFFNRNKIFVKVNK